MWTVFIKQELLLWFLERWRWAWLEMSTQNVAMIDCCFWSISFLRAGEVALSGRLLFSSGEYMSRNVKCSCCLIRLRLCWTMHRSCFFFLVMQSLELALHSKQGAVDMSLSWMLYALQWVDCCSQTGDCIHNVKGLLVFFVLVFVAGYVGDTVVVITAACWLFCYFIFFTNSRKYRTFWQG